MSVAVWRDSKATASRVSTLMNANLKPPVLKTAHVKITRALMPVIATRVSHKERVFRKTVFVKIL